MKILEILEGYGNDPAYLNWLKACRTHFPNCTPTGGGYPGTPAQAVDWTSINNEVAGDWDGTRGVVYEPGSLGKRVIEVVDPTNDTL